MSNARRYALDELALRPGTYFNPQTEMMVVVDDSPEVDHELFEAGGFESDEWVLISEEIPVDERKRDDLVELFQQKASAGGELPGEDDLDDVDDEDEDEEEEDDELDEVDDLELDRE